MKKTKSNSKIRNIIIVSAIVILSAVASILYFTKNNISLQEKIESHKRIGEKIEMVEANGYMNETVKSCLLTLYKLANSKVGRDDKTYKVSEDNADAIFAAYMLGLEDGNAPWKRKKTYV